MKYFLIFLTVLILSNGVFTQPLTQATGMVFFDSNANGRIDASEQGIRDVAVSNGTQVVLTDNQGRYALNVSDDAVIFVIKPATFQYPVNELNQPQFYYLHKPNGSPELFYSGVEPTGALPVSIDFPLVEGTNDKSFSMLVIADPQVYSSTQVQYYENDIITALKDQNESLFGITVGDIVGDRLNLMGEINQATAHIGLPWFHVLGNHDMNKDITESRHCDETFERHYGPSTYAFNQGLVHFIILNSVIFPNTYNNQQYIGGLTDDQFTFIENSLNQVPKDNLIVMFMHIPLYNEEPWGETFREADRNRLFDLLKDRPHTFSLSGHTHTQRHYYFTEEHGWQIEQPHHHYTLGTASGDWWSGAFKANGTPLSTMRDGSPNGFTILNFNGNEYRYDYRPTGLSSEPKLKIYGPKIVPHKTYFRGEIFVNFYQGSEKDTVFYRMGNEAWQQMLYTIEQDPGLCALRYEWDHAETFPEGLRPSNPSPCYHL